jgi:hypothetical protein
VLLVVILGLDSACLRLMAVFLSQMVEMLMPCLAHDRLYPGGRLYSAPGRALQGLSSFAYHLLRGLAQHLGLVAALWPAIFAPGAGFYHSPSWNKDYPRMQILTIDQLLYDAEVKMPPQFATFKQAQRVQQSDAQQAELPVA